jgi:hypothetical protein
LLLIGFLVDAYDIGLFFGGQLVSLSAPTVLSSCSGDFDENHNASPFALLWSRRSRSKQGMSNRSYGPLNDQTLSKLSRSLRAITDAPVELSLETQIGKATKEIVAAEKLQALEVKRRDTGKPVSERKTLPDRHRHGRDLRMPTL